MGQSKEEDALVARELGSIAKGCYIDFGAGDPSISNTWVLYQRGWRGLCVEPIEEEAAYLAIHRPEDKILMVALGPWNGDILFGVHGGNTSIEALRPFDSEHFPKRHITCRRPMSILEDFPEFLDKPFEFCDIDIEESEQFAIPMIDWRRFQPGFLMVEVCHGRSWEWAIKPFYETIFDDGSNAFYRRKNRNA